jgi:hypothetical protein
MHIHDTHAHQSKNSAKLIMQPGSWRQQKTTLFAGSCTHPDRACQNLDTCTTVLEMPLMSCNDTKELDRDWLPLHQTLGAIHLLKKAFFLKDCRLQDLSPFSE